jgi:hypothetical protein
MMPSFQWNDITIPMEQERHFNGTRAPFQWNNSTISMEQEQHLNGTLEKTNVTDNLGPYVFIQLSHEICALHT